MLSWAWRPLLLSFFAIFASPFLSSPAFAQISAAASCLNGSGKAVSCTDKSSVTFYGLNNTMTGDANLQSITLMAQGGDPNKPKAPRGGSLSIKGSGTNITTKAVTITGQGHAGMNGTGPSVPAAYLNIIDGASLTVDGGISFNGVGDSGGGYDSGTSILNVGDSDGKGTGTSNLIIDGSHEIRLGTTSNEANDALNIYKNGKLTINKSGHVLVTGKGHFNVDGGEIYFDKDNSDIIFTNGTNHFQDITIDDSASDYIKAGSITSASQFGNDLDTGTSHITLQKAVVGGDITVKGHVNLDKDSLIQKGGRLEIDSTKDTNSALNIYNTWQNTISTLAGDGTLNLWSSGASLKINGEVSPSENFSGTINANDNTIEFGDSSGTESKASVSGATLNQADIQIDKGASVRASSGVLTLNGNKSDKGGTINIDKRDSDADPFGFTITGSNTTLNIGNLEVLKSKGMALEDHSTLEFSETSAIQDQGFARIGLELNPQASLRFDQSHIKLNNPVPNGTVDLTVTGDISGRTKNSHESPTVGPCGTSSCIGNTYDHLTFYDTEVTGDSLHMIKGWLYVAPDSYINDVDTLTLDSGTAIQLQSWETDKQSRDIVVEHSVGHLTGYGTISLGESTTLDITGTHAGPLIDPNNQELAKSTKFSGTIMSTAGMLYHQILNFNDETSLTGGARIEAINNVGFYHDDTSITGSKLLGNQITRLQGGGTITLKNTTIGTYKGDDLSKDIEPINSGIVWAGYRDLYKESDKSAFAQPTTGILSVTDKSSIQTEEFFIGRTGTGGQASEIANFTGTGVTADLGQLVVGQASESSGTTNSGTLNITSGAKISVDNTTKYSHTKTPGIYVGNNSGSGLDDRTASAAGNAIGSITISDAGSTLSLKDGVMHVGSNDKTGSGNVEVKSSGSLSLKNSTLNVHNTGAVYVDGKGVLNANASSFSLGNVPPATQSFDDNQTGDTPPTFDKGLVAGDINIDHGTLNVTGNAGAAKFSGTHTGNLELHNGSTLNVGSKEAAGSLNVDGNMIIDDDTVSHFYEGDAKPCPTGDQRYSCSHGPSKETNPTDDSVIRVSGSLHIGGTLNISGTDGHPNQFDEGLYTIYTYRKGVTTGKDEDGKDITINEYLSGKFSDLNIASGDYIATLYTDHNGEVDVLIWGKDDAPPTVIGGGKVDWDKASKDGDGSVIIDGNDGNGNPKDTDITIDGKHNKDNPATAPNIIIHSGGTTIDGGAIAGKPTVPKDGDSSKDSDAPIHIDVNGDDNASGKISSDITDPKKKNPDDPDSHTSIKKDGDGDLVIDGGKKDYTGGTDVAGGTLDIGTKDGSSTADITNSSGTTVDNGGTVNVNKGSKAGDITVNGGGTANIDGQTSHIDNKGGTTNINGDDSKNTKPKPNDPSDTDNTISNTDGGTVNVNDGGKTGKIDSKDSNTNVNKGGQSGDIHSDGGSVNVDGQTGKIDVDNGGTANIDGDSGRADAEGGSTISGSGTIHGDATVGPGSTIHAGSTTDPSKSDSGIHIDGDLNMGGNSTIDGSSGGTINVDGNTNISDGPVHVHVHVDGNNGCSEAGKTCTDHIIHSGGVINDPGHNLSPDDVDQGPLVKRKVVIDGGDVDVQSTIPTYVVPGTNSGTGSGLDDLSHNDSAAAHSVLDPLSNINNVAGLKKAYESLSGEINADARTAMIDDGYMLQEAVIQRLDCMNDDLRRKALGKKGIKNNYCTVDPKHHFTVWGRMFGTRGDSFGSGQATMTQSSAGWIVGSDAQIAGTWRVGGILSYGRDWFGAHDIQSTGHSDDVSLGMYAGNSWNMNNGLFDAALVLKMGAIYTWNILHTHRTVAFQGYNGSLSANTLGSTFQGFSELGYKMLFNKHHKTPIEVEPFARLSFINFDTDNYREHGATAALDVHGEGTTVGYIDLGVKVASSIPINDGSYFSPHAALSYRGAFGDTNPRIHEQFAAANSGNYDMTINGVPISANTADLNIGFTVHVDDKIDFDMDYIGQYGSHITSSGGMGTFRYRF